jgi:spore coat protein CotF
MDNKVNNPYQEVKGNNLYNDLNMLQDILNDEKNISNNLSIALNEMSNETLYDEVMNYYNDTKDSARILFDLMFKNGWYTLEKAEENKISEAQKKLSKQFQQLNN